MNSADKFTQDVIDGFAGTDLFKIIYKKYSDSWDHDHCEICGIKFTENPSSDDLNKDREDFTPEQWQALGSVGRENWFAKREWDRVPKSTQNALLREDPTQGGIYGSYASRDRKSTRLNSSH